MFEGEDMMVDEATDAAVSDDGGSRTATVPASADADDSAEGGGEFTGTNTQEVGIDEPDIVKTDGDRIITIVDNVMTYVDVSGDGAVVTDSLTLPEGWGHELFFAGDRAFVFTNDSNWFGPMPVEPLDPIGGDAEAEFAVADSVMYEPEIWRPAALILEVDMSDPSDLTVAASMRIAGQYLSARAIDDHVRLAVSSGPQQLPWVYPQTQSGEARATATNREIVDESTLEQWLPSYKITSDDVSDEGPLLDCSRVHHPAEFAGFDVISVVDLSLEDGLTGGIARRNATGVLAGGQTVYSSMDRFYVATTKWAGADVVTRDVDIVEWNDDYETDIHAFAIAPGEPTEYVASGSITGSLLNQFSMDEHEGFLRVIATDGSPWGGSPESETRLAVLEEQGERLVKVGEVGGLGRGEQLFSARLMGDVGFAVTFRQIDPFYVLDLRDPRNPQVAGELKIPGFSTYLHPVGDDYVLGVGQDATEEGRTLGLKLSLFDVSEPNDPREVSVWTLRDANSPVEWDHRAFQMWGSKAIVPTQSWSGEFNGAIVFDIGDTIVELGRVTHQRNEVAPSSDCRPLTTDDVPEDTELWWMADDPSTHLQLCESGAVGGFGGFYCERYPADELRYWFYDEGQADDVFERLGVGDDDFFEMCWRDDYYREQIERSLVIDGTLWTMTRSALQANDATTFEFLTQVPIR